MYNDKCYEGNSNSTTDDKTGHIDLSMMNNQQQLAALVQVSARATLVSARLVHVRAREILVTVFLYYITMVTKVKWICAHSLCRSITPDILIHNLLVMHTLVPCYRPHLVPLHICESRRPKPGTAGGVQGALKEV